ncbi:MAG: alpha/beta hydrolase [Clostridia bacterium]|nr:alpha/beta hydrolase [Clostridia bacterium]
MNINIDGLDIHYIDEGEGPVCLFLHGWGSSCDAYRGVITAIKGNYRCIAIDFPGFGKSQIMDAPWGLDDYTSLVKKFCSALELGDPIIFGHSHGGRVALKIAAEKILRPQKMVLFDAAGLIPKKSLKTRVRARSFKIIKGFCTLPGLKKPCAGLLERARNYYGSADYNAAPPVLRQTLVSLVNTDLRDILEKIEASTLLIWGENDTATPLADAKIIESKIKDCGLYVIENAGHWSFVEYPGIAVAAVKSFLGVR